MPSNLKGFPVASTISIFSVPSKSYFKNLTLPVPPRVTPALLKAALFVIDVHPAEKVKSTSSAIVTVVERTTVAVLLSCADILLTVTVPVIPVPVTCIPVAMVPTLVSTVTVAEDVTAPFTLAVIRVPLDRNKSSPLAAYTLVPYLTMPRILPEFGTVAISYLVYPSTLL